MSSLTTIDHTLHVTWTFLFSGIEFVIPIPFPQRRDNYINVLSSNPFLNEYRSVMDSSDIVLQLTRSLISMTRLWTCFLRRKKFAFSEIFYERKTRDTQYLLLQSVHSVCLTSKTFFRMSVYLRISLNFFHWICEISLILTNLQFSLTRCILDTWRMCQSLLIIWMTHTRYFQYAARCVWWNSTMSSCTCLDIWGFDLTREWFPHARKKRSSDISFYFIG